MGSSRRVAKDEKEIAKPLVARGKMTLADLSHVVDSAKRR